MNNTIKIDGIEYNLVPVEKKEEVKQEYKLGDWVVFSANSTIVTLRKIIGNNDYALIGSSQLENMYGDWMSENAIKGADSYIKPATKEEIETHLITLAKKKGYDKAKRVISTMHPVKYELKFNELTYNSKNDILSDGIVSIYQKGVWAVIVKEEEKKLTFGSEQVTIDFNPRKTTLITCKGETGTFAQLDKIILNPFQINDFGNIRTKTLMTLPNTGHVTLTDKPLDIYKNLIACITIGCLTGTYKELLDIYNHILELNKK